MTKNKCVLQTGLEPVLAQQAAVVPFSTHTQPANCRPLSPQLREKLSRLLEREPQKTLSWLQTLVAVGECGSYSAAAKMLWKANAGVISKAMKSFQEDLELRLIEFSDHKGVHFSSAGQELLQWAAVIVRELRELLGSLPSPSESGTL